MNAPRPVRIRIPIGPMLRGLWASLQLVAGIAAITLTLSAAFFYNAKRTCSAEWADSGYAVRWSAFGGCRIQTMGGRWVPSHAYKLMEVQ